MLPTKRRVKKENFPEINGKGRSLSAENFYVRFLERKDDKPSLFSFVVPAKINKTSVGRHQIKRKMTAIVEKVLPGTKKGLSVIIFNKKDVSSLPYSQIETEILDLMHKIGALK